jgi:hypothetical protein
VKAFHTAVAAASVAAALAACVPSGSAPPYDAGTPPSAVVAFVPSLNVMTAPFEDTFDRPDAGEVRGASLDASAQDGSLREGREREGGREGNAEGGGAEGGGAEGGGAEGGRAEGGREATAPPTDLASMPVDRGNLGPNWIQIKTSAWRVEGGKLCGQNARNHPVWLNRTLPVNARIEFDVTGYSDDGDLKAEVWGDGTSYATGTSYTNATSYLAILGGWKNSLHVLARLNEHGTDRKEIRVDKDSDDPRQRPAQKGQTYHFKIERSDGKTVRWSVDGVDFVTWTDPAPLAGQGHDHFGFNEWEARVCFDNVKVTPL